MSVQEQLSGIDLNEEAKVKLELEKAYGRLEALKNKVDLAHDEAFKEWMLEWVSTPLQETIIGHLVENDTNKSFKSKGKIQALQTIAGWVLATKKSMETVKIEIAKMEQFLANEQVDTNFRPEN